MISVTSLPSPAIMFSVLKLFVIPAGGGIPAGILFAKARGVAWPITTLLYLVSDLLLALAFEPILRMLALLCSRIPVLARVGAAMKEATARNVAYFGGVGAGPVAFIMIAFGVDPMTGRASALAAGHGFLAGWAFAIAGDMLYFGVIALTTLSLNNYIRDPNTTMWLVLGAMFVAPMLVRRMRARQVLDQGA